MTPSAGPARVTVEDSTQVRGARTLATDTARGLGLAAGVVDQVALVATELAENLHRHAVGGELLLVPPEFAGDGHLAVIALDRGPGVEHFDRCLVDGYTTAGTLGGGLGAAQRLASGFDAVSEPGRGTVVRASFRVPGAPAVAPTFDLGAIGFPLASETVNGDGFATARRGSRLVVLTADGLGHGPDAAAASGAAAAELAGLSDLAPAALLSELNERIGSTRGAAVSVAGLELDVARAGGELVSAGLGNVSVLVAGPDGGTKRVATSHGTAGTRLRSRLAEQRTPFPAHGVLVMHSDGLTSRWTFEGRAALLRHRAEVIAAALWRDHSRGSDDSMVLVVRAGTTGETGGRS